MNRIKRFYSVENLVLKPVGEQDKTHELSLNVINIETINMGLVIIHIYSEIIFLIK